MNESILDLLDRLHTMVPALLKEVEHPCQDNAECEEEPTCLYCRFCVLSDEIRTRKRG